MKKYYGFKFLTYTDDGYIVSPIPFRGTTIWIPNKVLEAQCVKLNADGMEYFGHMRVTSERVNAMLRFKDKNENPPCDISPGNDCKCGFYVTYWDDVWRWIGNRRILVVVELGGKIIIGDTGRAKGQYALPIAIVDYHRPFNNSISGMDMGADWRNAIKKIGPNAVEYDVMLDELQDVGWKIIGTREAIQLVK